MRSVPRYMQIINYYSGLIESGKLRKDDQMPTEESICSQFNVSRITVRQALNGLAQSGYIYKIQGKGSFVSSKKADMQLNHLIGFSDEMRNQGMEPSTRLLDLSVLAPSDKMAQALHIDKSQKIYSIVRLRCADGIRMAIERVYMPFYRFAGLGNQDLTQSLYRLLSENYGCEPSKAVQSIRAGAADSKDAAILEVKAGSPVLIITRTTYSVDDLPFEYVESTYRGDKYVFNVTISR